ncbi:unnamed protein product, partial [Arabidopsis halleri]
MVAPADIIVKKRAKEEIFKYLWSQESFKSFKAKKIKRG